MPGLVLSADEEKNRNISHANYPRKYAPGNRGPESCHRAVGREATPGQAPAPDCGAGLWAAFAAWTVLPRSTGDRHLGVHSARDSWLAHHTEGGSDGTRKA
jgi:hypothetical protein